jgi:Sulfotransferase family
MAEHPDPNFCFVLGCQRSGTTALTRLLQAHDNIVIGMERYKALLTDPATRGEFGPALFEAERFLDFRPGDTNITPDTERFEGHYRRAAERFRKGEVRYVGDKVFPNPWIAEAIEERFPSPKVIFIYRDLLRVASSFMVRANNPNDPSWTATHEQALYRWTRAFEVADDVIERLGPENVFAVPYERLFSDDRYLFRALFDFLGLPIERKLVGYFKQATSNWDTIEAKPLTLDAEQQAFLLERMDASLPARFDARVEEQFAQHLIRPDA